MMFLVYCRRATYVLYSSIGPLTTKQPTININRKRAGRFQKLEKVLSLGAAYDCRNPPCTYLPIAAMGGVCGQSPQPVTAGC